MQGSQYLVEIPSINVYLHKSSQNGVMQDFWFDSNPTWSSRGSMYFYPAFDAALNLQNPGFSLQ